jgi:DNA-binding response OmpR family regulator
VTFKVLLIDGEAQERETYRSYLMEGEQYKYSVLQAETGEQGLNVCKEQFPDAILLDYLLPDMNGLEFISQYNIQFGKTNVPIIITDEGNESIAVLVMNNGAAGYLVKKKHIFNQPSCSYSKCNRKNSLHLPVGGEANNIRGIVSAVI